jgi:hypothetical protein
VKVSGGVEPQVTLTVALTVIVIVIVKDSYRSSRRNLHDHGDVAGWEGSGGE